MSRHKKNNKVFFIKLGAAALMLLCGVVFIWMTTFRLPDLKSFEQRKILQSTKIYDRTGEILLYEINKDTKRTLVDYNSISRHIKNATVAIEDAEFYQHKGIKLKSILRAMFANFLSLDFSQGGSTITQQVVKNSILTSEKTITRKLKEWVLSLKLEQEMNKESILALYLNEVPYGGSIYGVEEASQTFFGKSAGEVNLAEAAYLAALPQAPTFYSPYGNNLKELEARKNLVLKKMLENKFISEDEYKNALVEKVVFKKADYKGIRAPHFVFYVQEYLEKKYGTKVLEEMGLKVITTLDYNLQEKAEEIVLKSAKENKEKFNAENASLVAIDPKTGQILVMVGSRDYFDKEIDGNFNVAIAHRQPGSAFKPFVYATALMKGYTPDTVVFDLETEFSTECNELGEPIYPSAVCYKPVNYDNKYRGPVTFREALAQSINVPSVKVLYLSGINDSLQTARDMGITSLEGADRYGLTLVLGGGEVSLLEMTSAYGVFANNGTRNQYAGILKIEDGNGNVLEEFLPSQKNVLPKEISRTISNMLSDNEARAPAFGESSYLYFPGKDVAAKTGTTNDYRDAWIIGYTPNIAVGAWAGNNNNSPMEKKVAGFIVAPMWNEFMVKALASMPDEKFKGVISEINRKDIKPVLRGIWQGSEQYFVDKISGKLATQYTPEQTKEERVVKNVHSILYWVDKNNPLGPIPKNPQTDPQFNRWEYAVRKWVKENGIKEENESIIPNGSDDIHTPENFPRISISEIKDVYNKDEEISVSVNSTGKYSLSKVDFYLNGAYIGASIKKPFSFVIDLSQTDTLENKNTLKVVGYDSVFNKDEKEFDFEIK